MEKSALICQTTKANNAYMMIVTVFVTVWCAGAVNKLSEVEERLRRTEDSSKENKSALSQLISHTQVQAGRPFLM